MCGVSWRMEYPSSGGTPVVLSWEEGTVCLLGGGHPCLGPPGKDQGYPRKDLGPEAGVTPLANRQTENITFPHPLDAGGNKLYTCIVLW